MTRLAKITACALTLLMPGTAESGTASCLAPMPEIAEQFANENGGYSFLIDLTDMEDGANPEAFLYGMIVFQGGEERINTAVYCARGTPALHCEVMCGAGTFWLNPEVPEMSLITDLVPAGCAEDIFALFPARPEPHIPLITGHSLCATRN